MLTVAHLCAWTDKQEAGWIGDLAPGERSAPRRLVSERLPSDPGQGAGRVCTSWSGFLTTGHGHVHGVGGGHGGPICRLVVLIEGAVPSAVLNSPGPADGSAAHYVKTGENPSSPSVSAHLQGLLLF